MPSEATPDLDALEAEFLKAEDALFKAREAFDKQTNRRTRTALAEASKAYDDAGRAIRRAANPERTLDLDEYNRLIRRRQQVKAAK
jgi:hypothetical protein